MRNLIKLYRVELILSSLYLLLAGAFALQAINENASRWETAREDIASRLAAIAALKSAQISAWRKERLADGRTLMESPVVRIRAGEVLQKPHGEYEMTRLAKALGSVVRNYSYDSATLLDSAGERQLSVPAEAIPCQCRYRLPRDTRSLPSMVRDCLLRTPARARCSWWRSSRFPPWAWHRASSRPDSSRPFRAVPDPPSRAQAQG